MPSSITKISSVSFKLKIVFETPISLLKFLYVVKTLYLFFKTLLINSFVVVFPTLPVTAITIGFIFSL